MLLKNLIKIFLQIKIIFQSLESSNSNDVRKNYIFLQLKEKRKNGEKYIKDAITKGASIIVCSKKCKFKDEIFL